MKGAAKCDKHCELQNSVNQLGFERILCFWDIPKCMSDLVPMCYSACWHLPHVWACQRCVYVCQGVAHNSGSYSADKLNMTSSVQYAQCVMCCFVG
jgi:hypothetical protein